MPTLVALFLAALQTQPVPRTDTAGRALRFDFPGLQIGVAEYDEGPTGTTVFYFPKGVKAAVDVRGGAPGTLNTDAVRLGYDAPMMQAVVFSGGSWYGLSAATGVANGLKAVHAARGDHDFIAGVLGAIIYDVGARRFSRVTPDDGLGRAALLAARPGWFPQGARGAGRLAMQGYYFRDGFSAGPLAEWPHSGQGGAFRQIGPTKLAVFSVVNALGAVVDRDGRVVRCRRNESTTCPLITTLLNQRRAADPGTPKGPTGNTTLTLVVTNQKLPFWALQRLAVQVHTSMARAIQPFATEEDGDVLYAVTTDEVDNPSLEPMRLGAYASELAWDAVLASVPELPGRAQETSAPPRSAQDLAGRYLLPDGGTLVVVVDSAGVLLTMRGNGRMYFDDGHSYRLRPLGADRFVATNPGADQVQFERSAGRVVGLILNPSPWSQRAVRAP